MGVSGSRKDITRELVLDAMHYTDYIRGKKHVMDVLQLTVRLCIPMTWCCTRQSRCLADRELLLAEVTEAADHVLAEGPQQLLPNHPIGSR